MNALHPTPPTAAPVFSRAAAGLLRVKMETFGFSRGDAQPSEDAAAAREIDGAFVAVIADGLGSAKEGGAAATRATETLIRNFRARPRSWSVGKALEETLRHLNRRFHQEAMARFESPEIATTIAVVAIEGDRAFVVNAGDSRIYLWRAGRLTQLSTDHRETHPHRAHVLTQAIGLTEELASATREIPIQTGDTLLLCTDGISDVLAEAALAELLAQGAQAPGIASAAHRAATDETRDDLTAITLRVLETGAARRTDGPALRVPDKLKMGDVIDGFTLRRSFRTNDRIWLAARAGESYVLKFAPRDAANNETILAAFVREVWHATQLQADCFPAVFVPEEATARYYTLEYINAPTLTQFLADHGPLAPIQAAALGEFILRAEQFLRGHDFVHGDLKPENILVRRAGDTLQFTLIDLGSVAELFSLQGRAGTPSYLAPERFTGAAMTESTEIFALGVTLYEALTGKLPYGEIEPFQRPTFHGTRRLAKLNPHIPPWLEAVVCRAIAVSPAARYEAYSEMLFELRHPEKVRPFNPPGAPLLERDPLLFYRSGFFALLVVCLVLLCLLLAAK